MDNQVAESIGGVGLETASGLLSVSPPVLFFLLGILAVAVRSNIAIPESASKLLSLFLLWAIGFKGGVELVAGGFTADTLIAMGLALSLAAIVPVWVYLALRRLAAAADAAALAACFGSVSVVTFLTACTALEQSRTPFSGHMAAVMAIMEAPAIIVALILLNLAGRGQPMGLEQRGPVPPRLGTLMHESLLNGPVLLLLGSIAIGVLTGERGYAAFKPLCTDAFPGALAFFLLDLGMTAARRVQDVMRAPKLLLAFAVVGPIVNASLAIMASRLLGIGEGDAILFAVLAASASYIAAPAALRLAIPQADPALYLSLSLGVTFPFNIIVGIPLYSAAVGWWW